LLGPEIKKEEFEKLTPEEIREKLNKKFGGSLAKKIDETTLKL